MLILRLLLLLLLSFNLLAANFDDYWTYIESQNIEISDKYTEDDRFYELSRDPDHGNKLSLRGMLEAVSALEAEDRGIMSPPIGRGPVGSDFIDGDDRLWDVKTPVSPQASHDWLFSPEKVLNSVLKELSKDDRYVLLDLSYLNGVHLTEVIEMIEKEVPSGSKKYLKIIRINSPFFHY